MLLAYIGYWRKYQTWPSRMQRLHMQGDPTGEVRRFADQVLAELREEEKNQD
jgi:hypothetical protein